MSTRRESCRRTGKRRYPDHQSAVQALHRFAQSTRARKPVRAYPCDLCKGWHITSQEVPGGGVPTD